MPEKQNIEWKEIWKDEYLAWIRGFANAQGGTLYIGKNDKGETAGLSNAGKLLEDLPNKIRDAIRYSSDAVFSSGLLSAHPMRSLRCAPF